MSKARKVIEDALSLSEAERLEIAAALIASVDGHPEAGWDDAWLAELDRRAAAAEARRLASA